jgi:hypothetical protein
MHNWNNPLPKVIGTVVCLEPSLPKVIGTVVCLKPPLLTALVIGTIACLLTEVVINMLRFL